MRWYSRWNVEKNMEAKKMKFINGVFIVFIAGLILSSWYQTLASSANRKAYPPPGQMIDVGGHRLHIHCTGQGEPAVVMESGMSGWSTDWSLVQPEIAKVTHVCSYDRAGYGWSEPGPQPRDSQQVATELHSWLSRSGIDGSIILVGHSLGGLFVQYYAKTYPQQIAGMVLVDSVHPEQSLRTDEDARKRYEGNLRALTLTTSIFAPTGLLRLAGQSVTPIADKLPGELQFMARYLGFQSKAYRALDGEMASFHQSQSQVQNAGPLPNVPLAVVSSTRVENFPPGFSADTIKPTWDELQADLGKSATLSQVIAANSGHYIHLDEPELVIQTVLKMIQMSGGN